MYSIEWKRLDYTINVITCVWQCMYLNVEMPTNINMFMPFIRTSNQILQNSIHSLYDYEFYIHDDGARTKSHRLLIVCYCFDFEILTKQSNNFFILFSSTSTLTANLWTAVYVLFGHLDSIMRYFLSRTLTK